MTLTTIEQILDDARHGKMFILVDDEDRENEGDLVIPAEFCDSDAVNFMATHGRGLICLPMEKQQIERLGLPPMAHHNTTRHQTAFTVSIEAREGVTTGISAGDRAHTIATAITPQARASDIASPGHIFPLEAREGGVLVRAGHTEAAVDISRLAGLNPSGVICEIMNDDGTMARLPDLIPFAEKHNLHIATIADLIEYRRQNEQLIEQVVTSQFNSEWGGEFELRVYRSTQDGTEHVALIKGDIRADEPTPVRVHALDVLSDVLADADSPRTKQRSMEVIAREGKGVLVLIQPGKTTLSERVTAKQNNTKPATAIRDYGIGAQILRDIGVGKMELLTYSPKPIVGLEGYGLEIIGYKEPT